MKIEKDEITIRDFTETDLPLMFKWLTDVLLPDTVRFICEANGYDAEKIGQHFLDILPKICPKEE